MKSIQHSERSNFNRSQEFRSCLLDEFEDSLRSSCIPASRGNVSIEISNLPCGCCCITAKTRDEMNMEVRRTLAKCNRVNTITTCSAPNKIAGVLQRSTPVRHLTISELPWAGTMTDGVEQEPPQ